MTVVQKVVLAERFFVPFTPELKKRANQLYKFKVYDEKACDKCELRPERHSDICNDCPAYLSEIRSWSLLERPNGAQWIGVPKGNRVKLRQFVGKDTVIKVNDIRGNHKMRTPIEFTGTLQPHQIKPVDKAVKIGRGVLKAPPRAGKCVVGSTLIATDKGIVPIKSLFDTRQEESPLDIKILTEKGPSVTSGKYQKVVDRTIRVRTVNGYSIQATPNHKLLVATPSGLVWLELDSVKAGDWLCVNTSAAQFSSTDCDTSLGKMTPELAELMGYLTANGYLALAANTTGARISFSSNDKSIQKRFGQLWEMFFGTTPNVNRDGASSVLTSHMYGVENFRVLAACGLGMVKSAQKKIPDTVLRSTEPCVRAFLRAHLACDNSIGLGMEFNTASKIMADQMHFLLTMLGGKGHRTQKIVNNVTYWRISYTESAFLKINSKLNLVKTSRTTPEYGFFDEVPNAGELLARALSKNLGGGWYETEQGKKQLQIFPSKKAITKNSLITFNALKKLNVKNLATVDPEAARVLVQLVSSNLEFSKVVKRNIVNKPVRVYDVCVPETKSFIANSIVSHNTVMSAAIACKMGLKTLIVASQQEWLDEFYRTFCGNGKNAAMTNAPDIEKFEGRKIVGMCKTVEDFKKYDICLCTYQTFLSKGGRAKLQKIKSLFGLIVYDEVHGVGAEGYTRVALCLNAKHVIGLTGTPDRKDGLFCFPAGTMVKTPAGDTPIEDLKSGDPVVAFDHKSNTNVVSYVSDTFTRPLEDLYEVAHERGVIRCTGDHKIWSVTRNEYVEAKDLKSSDVLRIS